MNGQECGASHHQLLHNSGIAYCNQISMKVAAVMKKSRVQPGLEQNILLEIQEVDVCGVATTVLFNGGSTAMFGTFFKIFHDRLILFLIIPV